MGGWREVRGWGQCGIAVSGGWRGSEGVGLVWDWRGSEGVGLVWDCGQWGLEGK